MITKRLSPIGDGLSVCYDVVVSDGVLSVVTDWVSLLVDSLSAVVSVVPLGNVSSVSVDVVSSISRH